jgi:hypothetical protein
MWPTFLTLKNGKKSLKVANFLWVFSLFDFLLQSCKNLSKKIAYDMD